jgi:hypothetical protein
VEADRPAEPSVPAERVGQVGEIAGNWDNGMYVTCALAGITGDFLIDSGSTTSLLAHHVYQSMAAERRPTLKRQTHEVVDVNGSNLTVYGYTNVLLTIGNQEYEHSVIVCDIIPEGIIGQDFLLAYVNKIDFQRYIIHTAKDKIQCRVGVGANMVCRVLVGEKIEIPASSGAWVPVQIPNAQHLSENGLVQQSGRLGKQDITVSGGIIDTRRDGEVQRVNIINYGSEPITLYPNTEIGTCESISEQNDVPRARCAGTTMGASQSIDSNKPASEQLPTHLQDVWDDSTEHLQPAEAEQLARLFIQYQDVFSRSKEDLGYTDRILHRIDTGDATPIKQHARRIPFGKRDIERTEVQKMLDFGIIEQSISPWASPVVLVNKKDGSTRFCVDYRRVNEATVKDAYPLPRVDDCLDALSGASWFSCVDLNAGYWQLGMAPEDKEKTAFATSMGLYQFTVLPFGLVSAPSTFSRLMEDTFRGLQWDECLLYIDDVIVPAKSVEESFRRLEHVFQRLATANLKLKPSKCTFFKKSIKFLGHVVSPEGVHTDPEKIAAVRDWPRPTKAKHLRSLLGLCSYYRRFVKGFGDIARPLHKLCEKGAIFQWSSDCETAFNTLKTALITAPILGYPQIGSKFILDTDASNEAVGAVLSQEQDGVERVVAYMSKALGKHEKLYCVTRKELLAVITALKHFHPYLYGQEILLRTDNAAVSWMRNLKNPTGQVARWLQEIETYHLVVTHRAGSKHQNADALSRSPCKACTKQEENDQAEESDDDSADQPTIQYNVVRVTTRGQSKDSSQDLCTTMGLMEHWQPTEIRQQQLEDTNIGPIFTPLDEGQERPEWSAISMHSSAVKTLWRHWDRLVVRGGMLYRKWVTELEKDSRFQLIVPESRKPEVLRCYHDIPTAAHLGTDKMADRIRQSFYWPALRASVEKYCRTCDRCSARKPPQRHNRAPLGQIAAGEPMERVAVDLLGPLPETQDGSKYILVICDCFTKWTEAIPVPNQEAETVARAFVDGFVTRFGTPLQLHSDQGRCFESNLFQQMCNLLQIDKARSSPGHPQANGVVERFNRTLTSMLTMYCENDQHNWDKYLPQVMMAYRASVHTSTGVSPNMMMLGREVTLPLEAVTSRPVDNSDADTEPGGDDYVCKMREKFQLAHKMARKNLKKHATYRKRHYDLKAKRRSIPIGQPVWLHDPSRKPGVCHKLTSKWKGPYVVVKNIDDIVCLVKKSPKQPAKAFHVDRLKVYEGKNAPPWVKKLIATLRESAK